MLTAGAPGLSRVDYWEMLPAAVRPEIVSTSPAALSFNSPALPSSPSITDTGTSLLVREPIVPTAHNHKEQLAIGQGVKGVTAL